MENKKVILITEDEPILRKTLMEKLMAEGLIVLEAKNGEEGLEMALHEHPDLILIDILLPKMDGITMLQKLREDEEGKKIKYIILTNVDSTDQIARAMEVAGSVNFGSFDYFVKSNIDMDKVVEKVKEKLMSED